MAVCRAAVYVPSLVAFDLCSQRLVSLSCALLLSQLCSSAGRLREGERASIRKQVQLQLARLAGRPGAERWVIEVVD